jgi:hypothetical protein
VTRFHSTPRNKKKTVLIEKGEQEKMIWKRYRKLMKDERRVEHEDA